MTDNDHEPHHEPQPKITGILARVLGPVGPEVTCEQCFDLLDQYVDYELADVNTDADLPGMRAHLEGCPACHEDYESLREMATGTPSRLSG